MDESKELEKMKERVDTLSDNLKEFAEKTEKRLLGEDASDRIKEKLTDAKQGAKETGEKVQTFVKEKPWHAAAIAAGLGFVLGMIGKGGRKDR